MMNNMMPSAMMIGMSLLWIVLGLLLILLLATLATAIFLLLERRHNARRLSYMKDPLQQQDLSQVYEQGYQPLQQMPETYQEGGRSYSYPQPENEQPTAEYPQEMPLQH